MKWIAGLAAMAVVATWCSGCDSAPASVHIEDYDAQQELRWLRHRRGYDFAWVNTRLQHVVRVVIPVLRSGAPPNECSGVLVGPDLVLTAGHCLKETAYLSRSCDITDSPDGRRGFIHFEFQTVQGSSGSGRPAEQRARRRVEIQSLIGSPGGNLFAPETHPRTGETSCMAPLRNRQYDGVLLRLADTVEDRGFARVRAAYPELGDLLPVIHHPGGDEKRFAAVEITEALGAATGAIIGRPVPLPEGAIGIVPGSSGAPLFDQEGFLLGLVSAPCGVDCVLFASVAALLDLPDFAAVLTPAEERSGFGLGVFQELPLGSLTTEVRLFEDGPSRSLGLVARPGDEFLAVGFASAPGGGHRPALVGYDSSGSVDPTFGSNGVSVHEVPAARDAQLVAVAPERVNAFETVTMRIL